MEEDKLEPILNQENSVPTVSPTPIKGNRKWMKKVIGIFFLVLIGFGVFRVVSFYITPSKAIQQVYLIPKDAIFIIQSNSPVADWKRFSESEPWQCLKKSPSFAEIAQKTETLDSILQENKNLLSLVGKRDLMISAHKVRNGLWDFLYIIDLQKISEIETLKEQIEQIYILMDYKVTYRKYENIDIIELKDPKTREILYTAFVGNHYIASYSSKLVEASINERNNPVIGLDPLFIEADKLVANKGLYRMYIQYAHLPELLEMYVGKENEYLPLLSQSMAYAGMSLNVTKDKFELNGYTLLNDSVNPYVSALLHSGKKNMNAHHILSDRTAFYTNIGFNDPNTFIKELEKALSSNSNTFYDTYKKSYDKIESMFDISLADDFMSWMSGEFAITELEPGLLGNETEMILAVHTKDMDQAKEKMAYIEKKIKKRTPVNVKNVTYNDYKINYIELKGFFALFFGKMFDKFEKPYYTYIDDYVVFSNKPAAILSFIQDYEQNNTLKNNEGFKQVFSQVEKKSTYFVYTNTYKFFPLLKPVLNAKTWTDLYANKEIAFSFPYSGFQIIGDQQKIPMQVVLNYRPYNKEPETVNDEDEIEDEDLYVISEQETLDELQRFYVEKFQGNIYREFYSEGALKSMSEIREGKRHGKYHEYYENGNLKMRGKYNKGKPKGNWKYYTEEGKFDRKEKM